MIDLTSSITIITRSQLILECLTLSCWLLLRISRFRSCLQRTKFGPSKRHQDFKLAVVDYGGIQVLFLRVCVGLNVCIFYSGCKKRSMLFVYLSTTLSRGETGGNHCIWHVYKKNSLYLYSFTDELLE